MGIGVEGRRSQEQWPCQDQHAPETAQHGAGTLAEVGRQTAGGRTARVLGIALPKQQARAAENQPDRAAPVAAAARRSGNGLCNSIAAWQP